MGSGRCNPYVELTRHHNVATQCAKEEEGEAKWKLQLTAWPLLRHKNVMATASIETVNTQNVLFFSLKDKKYVQLNHVKSGTTMSVT